MGAVIPIGLETLAAQIVEIGEFATLEQAVGAGFTSVGTGAAEYVAGQLTVIEGGAAAEVITMDSALVAAQTAAGQGATLAATQQTTQTASMSLLKTATGYKPCAVLAMDVGAVGACVAPLFGVAIGAGLYKENPKLWTDLSMKLLPFAYPGTTKIPTFLDIALDTQTGKFVYKVLTKMGIADAVESVLKNNGIISDELTFNNTGFHGQPATASGFQYSGTSDFWVDGNPYYVDSEGTKWFLVGGNVIISATQNGEGVFMVPSAADMPRGRYGITAQGGGVGVQWPTTYSENVVVDNKGAMVAIYGNPLMPSIATGWTRGDWLGWTLKYGYNGRLVYDQPGITPWAGEPAPVLPEPYPFPVIVPFPSTDPPPVDPETDPVTPITPVIPFPVEPIQPDPGEPPENWPEEEPWPTVVPFPWTNPDPDEEPWPEVIPFPLPDEPPEEWPNEPDTWPEPYPDEEPWPQEPEEWPDDVPWPETPPDDWPEEPWPEEPDEWPEEVPWPDVPPDEWPEEIPWPESPEEWPEEVPWPEEKPDDWPEEWPDKPWPESPDDWPDDVPWPTPWPENWPDDQPWPVPWPDDIPYPIPTPAPQPSPDPDVEPDPGEITNPDPEPEIEPWIQPTPNPDINPDPYVQPVPDPDVDPSQKSDPIQPYVPPDPPPDDEPYRPTPDPDPDPDPDPRPDPDPDPPPPDPTPLPDGIVPVPPVPNPPLPFDSSHGLISVYNPTSAELYAFSDWLWVTYADATIDKIWNNPFDGIITLFELYCDPTIDGRKNIRSGFLDSGVAADTVSRYTEINCGTLGIPEYYGDYFDYSPYSKAHIYLPFIGIQELNVDDIVGHYVNVTYRIDEYNGSCIAMITVARVGELNGVDYEYSNVMYQFSGSCSVELPLTGGSQASIRAGMMTADAYQQAANISATGQLIGGIASTIGGVLSLNAGGIGSGISQMVGAAGTQAYGQAQALGNMLSGKSTVQKSGQFGASHGALGIKKPFIVVTRPKQIEVKNYNMLYGYPAHKMVTIGTCKGYLRCREVHVLSTTATDEEKSLIETLLKSGVYVTE